MIDKIVKNIHILFFIYACFLGVERNDELNTIIQNERAVLESVSVKLNKIKKELKEVKQFKDDLAKSKERVQEVVENIERIQRQLPSEINNTEVNSTLTQFANELKMIKPDPEPLGEINNKFYFTREYKFEAQGTYLQILVLFEKLENLAKKGRILNVKDLTIKVSNDSDPRSRFKILKLTTKIEAYRYNNSFDMRKL